MTLTIPRYQLSKYHLFSVPQIKTLVTDVPRFFFFPLKVPLKVHSSKFGLLIYNKDEVPMDIQFTGSELFGGGLYGGVVLKIQTLRPNLKKCSVYGGVLVKTHILRGP